METSTSPESISAGVIVLLVILISLFAFCVFMAIKASKARSEGKKNRKNRVEELTAKGVTHFVDLNHVNGLPIPENAPCTICSYADKIEITNNGTKFNLDKSKLTDVCLQTDTEIQKQYVSSVGGAVGGAVLFGPLGAMVGGRAKEKSNKTVHTYLIFTYMKDDELQYIGFDASYFKPKAELFVQDFKNSNNQGATIDLSL